MKKVLYFILAVSIANAAQLDIVSKKIEFDEKKRVISFIGNATVTKEQDTLNADNITVELNEKEQPIRYTASKNVRANVFLNEKHYSGGGDILIYEPNLQIYTLRGNAFLIELDTQRRVYGEKIEVNQANGTYIVEGKSGEPAKFIFQIEDKK